MVGAPVVLGPVIVAAAAGIVLALLGLVLAVRGRTLELAPLILAGVTELALVALLAVTLVRLGLGQRPPSLALTLSYLIAVVLVPPFGAYWALGERSRWSNVVLSVTGLTAAVMAVRLNDLWPA